MAGKPYRSPDWGQTIQEEVTVWNIVTTYIGTVETAWDNAYDDLATLQAKEIRQIICFEEDTSAWIVTTKQLFPTDSNWRKSSEYIFEWDERAALTYK